MKSWALTHKKSILILLTVLLIIAWGALIAWWWIYKQNRATDTHNNNASSVQTAQTPSATPAPGLARAPGMPPQNRMLKAV